MWNFKLFNRQRASEKLKEFKNKKSKFFWISLLLIIIFIFLGLIFILWDYKITTNQALNNKSSIVNQTISPSPTPTPAPIPTSKILDNGGYHIFQSFNNCGPASLSMALRFYGIEESQAIIGDELRPYQISGGDNDDKSVTLEELAEYSKKFNLIPYHRPMGNPQIVKQFIANDIPVITRTWTKPDEDIGHYRVIKGYDELAGTFLQDDSLQNKNLTYTFEEFNQIWDKFNFEFLVLVPAEKQKLVEQILGENKIELTAWQNAVNYSLEKLEENSNDINTRFNLSVAYYHTGDYQRSIEEFEKVENQLTFRTLWYQIEPIESYFELGNYDRVFQITDKILNNQNRAFSELYILRGKSYEKLGNIKAAKEEFQKAVFYNENLEEAQELFNSP